jgi:hypothetical protein
MAGWRVPDLESVFFGIDTHQQNTINLMSIGKDGHFSRLKTIRTQAPLEFARHGIWNLLPQRNLH